MTVTLHPGRIDFAAGGRPAGSYVLDDSHKPHLHPLMTPSGRVVSAAITHDHKHHKGLMYALRPRDVNFWEERVTLPGEAVGRQVQTGLALLEDGFVQTLHWAAEDGSLPSFDEERRVTLAFDGQAFVWSWSTRLTALRDMVLMQSQWSIPDTTGRPVNYHGLGLRFIRSFGGMRTSAIIEVDGAALDFPAALGRVPRAVTLTGAFDGQWPAPRASVRIEQDQDNTLFALKDPFAYLALGPSNASERVVARGEVIAETYRIAVFDAPDAPA